MNSKIINVFLIINLAIYTITIFLSLDKPFWFDEVASIADSENIFHIGLIETLKKTLHPPLYAYLIGFFNPLSEITNTLNEHHFYLLRITNFLGLIPLLYAFKILKKNYPKINISLISLLLLSSYYFFYYSLELRMYFLILCFSFLLHSLSLISKLNNFEKVIFFISVLIVSLFHIYGFMISLSIMAVQITINIYKKDFKKNKFYLTLILTLIIIFLILFYFSIFLSNNINHIGWLSFQKWYYRVFLEWSAPSVIFLIMITLSIWYRYSLKELFNQNYSKKISIDLDIVKITFPAVVLLIISALISLRIPIVTHRNLIVIFPSAVLLAGYLYTKFSNYKMNSALMVLFLIFITMYNFNSFKNTKNSEENINWVIKQSFTENCQGVPLYFNDNGKQMWEKITKHSIKMYAQYDRPIKRLSAIYSKDKGNLTNLKKIIIDNKECDVFISSFHYRGIEKHVKYLNNFGMNLNIEYAPRVKMLDYGKSGVITKQIR